MSILLTNIIWDSADLGEDADYLPSKFLSVTGNIDEALDDASNTYECCISDCTVTEVADDFELED